MVAVLERVTTHRDVVFASPGGTELRLDLHLPRGGVPQAAVVYFHGGSWRRGHRADHEEARAIELAVRGYLVATVDYRLSGLAKFPAQLDDARAAVAWVRAHAATYGYQGHRVAAWGASAGGHLAVLLATICDTQGTACVDAAVSWFAPLDISALSTKSPLEAEVFPIPATDALLGARFDPRRPEHRAADPLSMSSAIRAPLLLMTGDRDRVIPAAASQRLHDAVVHTGGRSVLHIVGGAGHEDPAFDDPFVIDVVDAFLRRWLVEPPHRRAP